MDHKRQIDVYDEHICFARQTFRRDWMPQVAFKMVVTQSGYENDILIGKQSDAFLNKKFAIIV